MNWTKSPEHLLSEYILLYYNEQNKLLLLIYQGYSILVEEVTTMIITFLPIL